MMPIFSINRLVKMSFKKKAQTLPIAKKVATKEASIDRS
jgi:hypothetical protein